jgi:DNA invertase Pin-like site-specific DNA recombinase
MTHESATTDPTKAYIYCRSAASNESSIESQRARCLGTAKENHWTIGGIYVDNGVSGLKEHREGLDGLIAALQRETHGSIVVITANSSRLSRNLTITDKLLSRFGALGAKVVLTP